jgi:hypothetical protein
MSAVEILRVGPARERKFAKQYWSQAPTLDIDVAMEVMGKAMISTLPYREVQNTSAIWK